MPDAKQVIELVLKESMEQDAELMGKLLVPVLPGRASEKRPVEYVAVISESAQAKSARAGVWIVQTNVVVVTSVDDPESKERGLKRFAEVVQWFDPGCPVSTFIDERVQIYGFTVLGQSEAKKDRSWGDILELQFGCRVV